MLCLLPARFFRNYQELLYTNFLYTMESRTIKPTRLLPGRKRTFMALLFLLAGFTLQAQFTVTGTVLEEGTGSPLAGVNIVEAGNPSNGAISVSRENLPL